MRSRFFAVPRAEARGMRGGAKALPSKGQTVEACRFNGLTDGRPFRLSRHAVPPRYY